jgi:hypothetical protein
VKVRAETRIPVRVDVKVRAEVTSRPPVPSLAECRTKAAVRQVAKAAKTKAYARAKATLRTMADAKDPVRFRTLKTRTIADRVRALMATQQNKLLRMMTKVTKVSAWTRIARRTRITGLGKRIGVPISGEFHRRTMRRHRRKPVVKPRKGHLPVAFSLGRLQERSSEPPMRVDWRDRRAPPRRAVGLFRVRSL